MNRFREELVQVNLIDLVYAYRKHRIDITKPLTMRALFEGSIINKCPYGVKILGKGLMEFKHLNVPMHLEVSDASETAIEAIKAAGGTIKVVYHTETTLKKHIKPHKFMNPNVKIPMPPPDKVLKLEKLRDKGLDVEYPTAPWYEEYKK
jgi:large subunit ribosomal protein L15